MKKETLVKIAKATGVTTVVGVIIGGALWLINKKNHTTEGEDREECTYTKGDDAEVTTVVEDDE